DSAGAPDGGGREPGERLYDTCRELAADLVAVALWTPGGAVGTIADLASRLLASPREVRAGLRAAVSAGHLRVAGDLGDDSAPLTLTPLPPPPPEHGRPQSLWAEDLGTSTDPAFTDLPRTLERLFSAGIAPPGQTFPDDEPVRGDGGAGFLAIAPSPDRGLQGRGSPTGRRRRPGSSPPTGNWWSGRGRARGAGEGRAVHRAGRGDAPRDRRHRLEAGGARPARRR